MAVGDKTNTVNKGRRAGSMSSLVPHATFNREIDRWYSTQWRLPWGSFIDGKSNKPNNDDDDEEEEVIIRNEAQ